MEDIESFLNWIPKLYLFVEHSSIVEDWFLEKLETNVSTFFWSNKFPTFRIKDQKLQFFAFFSPMIIWLKFLRN